MFGKRVHRLALIALMLIVSIAAIAQERDRSKIPDKYKWNLADLYPSVDAWKKGKEQLVARIPVVEQYKGKLGASAKELLACLDFSTNLNKEFVRLAIYANLLSDQDTREAANLALTQEIRQVGADFGAKTSFIEPEILKIEGSTIDGFMKQEPKLTVYRQYLDDLTRRKAHTGTEEEEKIIADASLITDAPSSIYNVFSNADFPYSEVTLSTGKTVRLDKAAYNLNRALPNREDRKKVFDAFFGRMDQYKGTIGAQMYSEVKKNIFYTKARRYGSSLESALDGSNIPVQVYHSLISNVNNNLSTFHRYLALRKQMHGLDTLHYYDLYPPLLKNVDLDYSVEEAEKNILAAVRPLGPDYASVVKKALDERWIDMFPNDGKRAGAYSSGGAYDVHPYMLMNYNGKYTDMSTLIHELGHTMQSYLSNKAQAYPNASYPIFVAEVASTFNEALLMDHMLKNIKDDDARLSLLGNYLEGIKSNVFRQTQFAEFELSMHEIVEKGGTLTGESLNKLYLDLTRRYYGHDKGVCIVDDNIRSEWAMVPHFYRNYYVYQYATAFTASAALSEQVMAGDKSATKKYMEFLSAGGSDYPINLLKTAGVDMTTSQPLELTMRKMNRVMDEMESILKKKAK